MGRKGNVQLGESIDCIVAAPTRMNAKSPMNTSWLRLRVAGAMALQWALLTAACTDMLHSDSQNAGRRSAEAGQGAEPSMKISSSQAVAARPMEGQALESRCRPALHHRADHRGRSELFQVSAGTGWRYPVLDPTAFGWLFKLVSSGAPDSRRTHG